jgi:hypothetical protein
MLEAGSGTKFLTIFANLTLWTLFGSHKELGGASLCVQNEHGIHVFIAFKLTFPPLLFFQTRSIVISIYMCCGHSFYNCLGSIDSTLFFIFAFNWKVFLMILGWGVFVYMCF